MSAGESARPGGPQADALPPLETVEVETGRQPVASVIWLHGLGADGHDFEPAVPHLLWPSAPALRFVFPHAPVRPVTLNAGMRMRAWYDIRQLGSGSRDADVQGIRDSVAQAAGLVAREGERGIPPERVVVAGFSQGGAIAIRLALSHPQMLLGLVALSTYLLHAERLAADAQATQRGLPVFIGHGTADPIVPLRLGEEAATALRGLGCEVEWRQYPIPHSVNAEELRHIAAWLQRRLDAVP